MINVSRLYCDQLTPGDWLRYGAESGRPNGQLLPETARRRKPIVVWNVTRRCNLKCIHCYNDSGDSLDSELSTAQARMVLEDLAQFGVPSVLFSGGEPLMRRDLLELAAYAADKGIRTVVSTNGTLLDKQKALELKKSNVSYVGVSLDGIGTINDQFRGVQGAFEKTVAGIRHCMDADVRVGLRLTLTKHNASQLDRLFDFCETEGIDRICFYHLVPSGRGRSLVSDDLTHAQSRTAVETIMARAMAFKQAGRRMDILTVDNHVDGVYVYLELLAEDPQRAAEVWKLLTWNGGGLNSSGIGIGCIGYDGKVHPDQFWGHYDLGDVHQQKFSEIWSNPDEPLLKGLRNRRDYIKGRCRLCRYFEACGGSLRVRADLYFNDPWAPDPACYLSDDQIGLDKSKKQEIIRSGEDFKLPA